MRFLRGYIYLNTGIPNCAAMIMQQHAIAHAIEHDIEHAIKHVIEYATVYVTDISTDTFAQRAYRTH